MKTTLFVSTAATVLALSSAFLAKEPLVRPLTSLLLASDSSSSSSSSSDNAASSRKAFVQQVAALGTTAATTAGAALFLPNIEPATARGFATLDQAYARYGPRIRAGGAFYQNDLRQLVAKGDFKGINNALQEPPDRKKSDLKKPDAGVAERARQAGGFSDARVLVAADLFAGSFSDNSISAKTKKMKAAIQKVREVVEEMQRTTRVALGEEKVGGFFGIGANKPSDAESIKKIRELYVVGGNAWNEFVLVANDELPGQFDKFEFIK